MLGAAVTTDLAVTPVTALLPMSRYSFACNVGAGRVFGAGVTQVTNPIRLSPQ
jgi:hypothetical protein